MEGNSMKKEQIGYSVLPETMAWGHAPKSIVDPEWANSGITGMISGVKVRDIDSKVPKNRCLLRRLAYRSGESKNTPEVQTQEHTSQTQERTTYLCECTVFYSDGILY